MRMLFFSLTLLGLFTASCGKTEKEVIKLTGNQADPNAPSSTWKEHWFEHNQLVKLVSYNNEVGVYYDDDVPKDITWPQRTMTAIWTYTKATYGAFGQDKDKRLSVILHFNKYGGGHPATFFDASHDYRNMIDVGSNNPWTDSTGWNLDIVAHEVGHIVEGASKGTHNSPAMAIWHDSKWMEIYQYDVYKNLGWDKEATRWYNDKMNAVDNYPKAGTQWFKNWFYPIYRDHGGKDVLNGFFTLLSQQFPTRTISLGKEYTRDLNMGEFVHFWSGAAHTNLKQLALDAFGTNDEKGQDWTVQFEQARKDFPNITY